LPTTKSHHRNIDLYEFNPFLDQTIWPSYKVPVGGGVPGLGSYSNCTATTICDSLNLEIRYGKKQTALRVGVLAGLSGLSVFLVVDAAQAYPYAFASNQITALTITTVTGTTPGRITPTAYSATISDSSAFGALPSQTFSTGSSTPGTALAINQAFSGTTAAPPSSFFADGAGSFVGTRATSSISAGDATTGGVAVDNIAEGSGDNTSFGNSTANNKATIALIVVGTGEQVLLSFTDLFGVATSTSGFGETANASIGSTFSVLDADGLVASFDPSLLNQTIGSTNGLSSTDTGEVSDILVSYS
jgi:hypothetical protein